MKFEDISKIGIRKRFCLLFSLFLKNRKMEVMGIKFAPLHIPLKRRLETLAVSFQWVFLAFGGVIGLGISLYLIFYTHFWHITLLYLIWIWFFDSNTCEHGGRSLECVRESIYWNYFKNYFPVHLQKSSKIELDPNRNYLFCSFPHGLLATGVFSAFCSNACGIYKHFPNHKPHILTLKQNFFYPFFREFLLSIGMCSASAKSINWIMGSPEGGNVAVLIVGGHAETFYSQPGQYRLVLKNRKGFVKLALRNGSALVPVFSFGENDIFDQVINPEGSFLRSLQERIKKITGIAPIIPMGRGYFQYTFGLIARREPINVIVGKPIDVEKTENPTQEQIDALHETFIKELTELFEEHKHKYLKNPDNTNLIIC